MRPNGEELLRGIQGTLATYVLPELQTAHARLELMLVTALLGAAAEAWDGAAQRLVDENVALRELAGRAADTLGANAEAGAGEALVAELRSLAAETDASVRLWELTAANDRLHDAIGRLGAVLMEGDAPELRELRAAVVTCLRGEAESRSLALLGPRVDG